MKASDAVYEVLAAEGGPLHVSTILERVLAQGLWETSGKTPADTLSAILSTEINTQGAASRFARRGPNTFDLRRPDDPVPIPSEPGESKAWIFQANPKRYDLLAAIAESTSETWWMKQHREAAAYGDLIYFFVSGEKAGIYATGRIMSSPYRSKDEDDLGTWTVDVAYEATIDPPLLRTGEIAADPVLAGFAPFMGRMGTNFPIPQAVADRLAEVVGGRLRPAIAKPGKAQFNPASYELDRAVERVGQEAREQYLAHLRGLDPTAFEHVIRLLLEALDYEEVKVVGKSGDAGIDVRAVLRYRGVADVPTFVQAKRFAAGSNVDGSVVGRLRGSLPVEAHGIVITTSDFTKQARVEASASGLKPIALINGPALVDLLVDLGIGVEKRHVEVVRFSPDELERELGG